MHTPIDYLSYLGSDIAVSFMVLEIRATPDGTLSVMNLSVYIWSLLHRTLHLGAGKHLGPLD